MPTISLCMIARGNEEGLPKALESVGDHVDELVVVLNGTEEERNDSRAWLTGLGAKVVEFDWCDDFAAARNESFKHATGD